MTTRPDAPARQATVAVDTRRPLGRIEDNVYGHFLESAFFGNIEGGVLDDGSPLSLADPGLLEGLRHDVMDLCRELGPAAVRWPGGNFASAYHWEDGIGPRELRAHRLELAWGGKESNRFGTDEFLAWCEAVGGAPYLVHSARDVDEAVRWVEYTNSPRGSTSLALRRESHGRAEPWGVRYWGVGNEVYGPWQMGHRGADEHSRAAREHARFMKLVDPTIQTIAVGIPWDQEEWTRPLLREAGKHLDFLSLHLYGASTHLFSADDYDEVVGQSIFFEDRMQSYSRLVAALAAEAGLDRPPALALDEWTMRHLEPATWPAPQPGDDGGVADRETPDHGEERQGFRVNRWSPRTLADALFCAGVFHAVHRTAGLAAPVAMTNVVNLVNANGLVVARPSGALRSAAYHVWALYRHHTGRIALPVEVHGPARTGLVRQGDNRGPDGVLLSTPATIPDIDVSATLTDDGSLRLAMVNRRQEQAVHTRIVLDGSVDGVPLRARVRCLGGDVDDPMATNTLAAPDTVGLRDLGDVERADGGWTLPPHSVTVLALDLA
jgi:alpha-N-arabinofuranosidase